MGNKKVEGGNVKVAVPWALSHYIPLDGFHPLYRALFDHAPSSVTICAWDNVALHRRLVEDPASADEARSLSLSVDFGANHLRAGSIARLHEHYVWSPNRVLTEALDGEIEFHHTAPFPSLTRPFVCHCEAFAPVFFPFSPTGARECGRGNELREFYRHIFSHELCLGIYSHIPETLNSFRLFWADPLIDEKLKPSGIGLSAKSFDRRQFLSDADLSQPRFFFSSAKIQSSEDFFIRGGHIVLRFWREFLRSGRGGQLILCCRRPDVASLVAYGVDVEFLDAEAGRTIVWFEGLLPCREVAALLASANFMLLPSVSLDSTSMLMAKAMGAVPVVSDTLGASVFVKDDIDAVVLSGMFDAAWRRDPDTGVLVDCYSRNDVLDESLVKQMTDRVIELVGAPNRYRDIRLRSLRDCEDRFSGEQFASDFWSGIVSSVAKKRKVAKPSKVERLKRRLKRCELKSVDVPRVFDSPQQPVRRLYTGESSVYEWSGSQIHVEGRPELDFNDFCVLAPYLKPDLPSMTFAAEIRDLQDLLLPSASDEFDISKIKIKLLVSRALSSFPMLHRAATASYRNLKRATNGAFLYKEYLLHVAGKPEDERWIYPLVENFGRFDIVRYYHRVYAYPREEGPFSVSLVRGNKYSKVYAAYRLSGVLKKIGAAEHLP